MNQPDQTPHSSDLRQHREMHGQDTFFATKCLQPRLKIVGASAAAEVCSALCYHSTHGNILLAAFIIMPDHWHALFATCNGQPLPNFMHTVQWWIGRRTNQHLQQNDCHWQDGYYETRIRSTKQHQYVSDYIESNPVRAGLVKLPSEWEWSSASLKFCDSVNKTWLGSFENDG
jgi:putative transposase